LDVEIGVGVVSTFEVVVVAFVVAVDVVGVCPV
jgi:hypothetical protein